MIFLYNASAILLLFTTLHFAAIAFATKSALYSAIAGLVAALSFACMAGQIYALTTLI